MLTVPTAGLTKALTPTHFDVSQVTQSLLGAPIDQAQERFCPSTYPLPGSSQSSLAFPTDTTLSTLSSFSQNLYDGINYFPNYQSHNTIYSPHTSNSVPRVNLQATRYPYYRMPAGTATSATSVFPQEESSRQEQSFQFTFRLPFAMPPEAASVQHQQQTLYGVQETQENVYVGESQQGAEGGRSEDHRIQQESHTAPVEPENKGIHYCCSNPKTACTGRSKVCLDVLCKFVAKHPDYLTAEQIAEFVFEAIAPKSNEGQSTTSQLSPVSTNDLLPSQYGRASWETASSGSSTTASTSSPRSSPSGSCLAHPNHSGAASKASSIGSSKNKRKRSEDYPEDCLNERGDEWTGTRDNLEDNTRSFHNQAPGDGERRRKKRNSTDDGEFFCIICVILKDPHPPLSRKDALKRHIRTVHEIFQILLSVEYWDFKVLKPRWRDQLQTEDFRPLIVFGIALQAEARKRGVEIEEYEDLKRLYPDVTESMKHS